MKTASVPRSNRKNETSFARLDNLKRDMQRLKPININGMIKSKQNKTMEWLENHGEKNKIVQVAMKSKKRLLEEDAKREAEGRELEAKARALKLAQAEARTDAAAAKKQALIEVVNKDGVWEAEELEVRLNAVRAEVLEKSAKWSEDTKRKKIEAAQVAALHRQIDLRVKVFGEKGSEKEDTQKASKKDGKFDSGRLKENLKRIIQSGRPAEGPQVIGRMPRTAAEQESFMQKDFARYSELHVPLAERERLQAQKAEEERAAKVAEAKAKEEERVRKAAQKLEERARTQEERAAEKERRRAEKRQMDARGQMPGTAKHLEGRH